MIGLVKLTAVERNGEGSRAAARVRKSGLTPAILFSLPGNESRLISLDTRLVNQLVSMHAYVAQSSLLFNSVKINCMTALDR